MKYRRYLPAVVYGCLAIAVMWPFLFNSGYILTLDMGLGPATSFTNQIFGLNGGWVWFSPSLPINLVLSFLGIFIPMWLLEKLLLLSIFFLAGLGAHWLLSGRGLAAYFAGVLYMINPFTYVRFLAGQWGVLGAYALTPFAVHYFIKLLEEGGRKNAVKTVILATLVGAFTAHWFLLLFLAYLILFLFRFAGKWGSLAGMGREMLIAGVLFIFLNSYWLVPFIASPPAILSQINSADMQYFAPHQTSSFGLPFDVAALYGFWRPGYILPQDVFTVWWLIFIFILALAVYGFITKVRDKQQRRQTLSFAVIAVAGFLAALGATNMFTRVPFEWLWQHVPFFSGLRDSQKFDGLLCLAYSYLGGLAVAELIRKRENGKRIANAILAGLVAICLIAPFAYTPSMFGFSGQIKATDYPADWYRVNDYLAGDTTDFNVLFLPWHLYMDYSWLPSHDKRVGDMAKSFFNKPVISGDNIEVPGTFSESLNPASQYVEFLIKHGSGVSNLGELIAPLNVKYVILVNEADYQVYDFLYRQGDLAVVIQTPGLVLFRNEHPAVRAYGVDRVVKIKGWDDLLLLSQTQEIMQNLYITDADTFSHLAEGPNPVLIDSTPVSPLRYTKRSDIHYRVEGTQHRYTIFVEPQDVETRYWQLQGEKSLNNLGFIPAFVSAAGEGEIVYARFWQLYVPGYLLSLVCLILAGWYYFRSLPFRFLSSDGQVESHRACQGKSSGD